MRSILLSCLMAPALLLSAPAIAEMPQSVQAAGKWRVAGNISDKAFVVDCLFDERGPQLGGMCVDVVTGEGKAKPGKSHVLTQGSVRGPDIQWTYSTKVMFLTIDIAFAGKTDGKQMKGIVSAKGRKGTFTATRI